MQIHATLAELEEVERLAVPYSCSNSTRDKNQFEEFLNFLEANSCKIKDSIVIEQFGRAEFGVKAKKAFAKGDTIFEVPSSIILTLKDSVGLSVEKLFDGDKMLRSMPNVALAMLVLFLKASCSVAKNGKVERKDITKWRPYMNILPNEYHTPLYFTLEEIKMIQPAQCFCNFIELNVF